MNNTIQTILVILTLSFALGFLAKKYFVKTKKKTAKGCGSGNCGCD